MLVIAFQSLSGQSARIEGSVYYLDTHKPVFGCPVYIMDSSKYIGMTDKQGRFVIKDLAPGKYDLVCDHFGDLFTRDTIEIVANDEVVTRDFFLESIFRKLTPTDATEKYHETLAILSQHVSLFDFKLTSAGITHGNRLSARISLKSNVDIPLYFWRNPNHECCILKPSFKMLLISSKGDTLHFSLHFGCDYGTLGNADVSDCIVLSTKASTAEYYFVQSDRAFSDLPNDTYAIKVIYDYVFPEYIPRTTSRELIDLYLKGIRGKHIAQGSIIIDSKAISHFEK